VICLDREDYTAGPKDDFGGPRAKPDNAVYILYTSGSTGRPKGVVVEHRQLLTYVDAILALLDRPLGANFAMVQPLTVDSCKTTIYPPLLTGGCLYLTSREQALDPDALGAYFEQQRIDCLKIAPSHLAALMQGVRPERLLPRRWLIIGGESSRLEWVEQLARLAPDCKVFNHYGPTETTVGVLTHRVRPGEGQAPTATTPIGRPLANTRAYILDNRMQPVPIGAAGELYIGGGNVARGYLNRPDLTANQFLPDPFSGKPGARLYRTGDLVRYRNDGTVEFLGRNDDQVKIRGYRIEPGEVEAVLAQHPAVRSALVLGRDNERGERQLVAYWTATEAAGAEEDVLRAFLKEKLPEYMVPAALVQLVEIPRTPHGKVDSRALPAPPRSGAAPGQAQQTPRTPVEEVLAAIWSEVLRLERVGIHDNFFDLGGHSLLATRVISRIREAFAAEVPLRALFETPTVAGLAVAVLDRLLADAEPGVLAALLGEASDPPDL
jgi:amino acid adenylation domain-containing protein